MIIPHYIIGSATSTQPLTTPSFITTTDEIDGAIVPSHTELPASTPHSNNTYLPTSIPTAQSLELILSLVALGLLLLGAAVLLLIIILMCICRQVLINLKE